MNPRFLVMIAVSLLVFFGVIRLVLRHRHDPFPMTRVAILGLVVVVVGMLYGYYGARSDWPWWIFYPPPMLLTVFAPPVVLRMHRRETALYLVLSFLSAPLIHVAFSLLLGWDDYMPFLPVPSLADILA